MSDCDIRLLTSLREMDAAVDLQRDYWGDRPEGIVPRHMLYTIAHHGGHVLGACCGGQGQLVAMLVGLPGLENGTAYLVSKRMVVHADWRRRGLAARLKLAQRERAMQQGLRRVRWTFDPLLAANARLNLHRLGAVATAYCEDYFGAAGPGGEADAGSPDRLQVDWRLQSETVRALAQGRARATTLAGALAEGATWLCEARRDERGLPVPGDIGDASGAGAMLLEIPGDFMLLARRDARLAQAWREHLRAAMQALFAAGHELRDCVRGSLDGVERLCYLSGRAQVEADGDGD